MSGVGVLHFVQDDTSFVQDDTSEARANFTASRELGTLWAEFLNRIAHRPQSFAYHRP